MSTTIDPLFGVIRHANKVPRLVDVLEINRNYEGASFLQPTTVLDIRTTPAQFFYVQTCSVSVGGQLSESVSKTLNMMSGEHGEHVLFSHTEQSTDVKLSAELSNAIVSDRLVVQMQASTALNAYSTLFVKVHVYEL